MLHIKSTVFSYRNGKVVECTKIFTFISLASLRLKGPKVMSKDGTTLQPSRQDGCKVAPPSSG